MKTEIINIKPQLSPNGLGVGRLKTGKTIFVYGALPQEKVEVSIIKEQNKFCFGKVISIMNPNPNRVEPKDQIGYLSTSPFQIATFTYENQIKSDLVFEALKQQKLLRYQDVLNPIIAPNQEYFYRNKYVYEIKGNLPNRKMAVFDRLSNKLIPVDSISLASEPISRFAQELIEKIPFNFQSMIVRNNFKNETFARIYTKEKNWSSKYYDENIESKVLKDFPNLEIFHFDEEEKIAPYNLFNERYLEIEDELSFSNFKFRYDLDCFWQTNSEVFSEILEHIFEYLDPELNILDCYCGIGSIGLSLRQKLIEQNPNQTTPFLTLVESDPHSVKYLQQNCSGLERIKISAQKTEKSLNLIESSKQSLQQVIFDPPRKGLDPIVIQELLKKKPQKIIYLSCNPMTLFRDFALLQEFYEPLTIQPFNMFPKTYHIECLMILKLK